MTTKFAFISETSVEKYQESAGDVAALVRSQMNGSIPFERTIKQRTETMPLAPKKYITAAHNEENYKLTRAATLLESVANFFHRT